MFTSTETSTATGAFQTPPTVAAHAIAPAPNHKIMTDNITVDLIKVIHLSDNIVGTGQERGIVRPRVDLVTVHMKRYRLLHRYSNQALEDNPACETSERARRQSTIWI
jgi:hypothetical protein